MPDITIHIPDDKLVVLAEAAGCSGTDDCETEVTAWLTAVARDRIWSAERQQAINLAMANVPNPIPTEETP